LTTAAGDEDFSVAEFILGKDFSFLDLDVAFTRACDCDVLITVIEARY
jgi:hypothetical protein